MIDDYRALAVFVCVADSGSFSQAGRRLRLSTSVISHHITKLEDRLGVSLFFRSTRSLTLTVEGQAVLGAARRMVEAGEEALDALAGDLDQPVGSLRIAMPAFGQNSAIHQAVWDFAKAHPLVSISINSSDAPVDLVREGFDLGIRLGVLKDAALKSRKIGVFHRVLCAAPGYLASRPPITNLEDLNGCDYISMSMLPDEFDLVQGQEHVLIEPHGTRIEVSSVTAACAAVLAGLGLQRLPLSEVGDHLDSGALVQVLPTWTPPLRGIYAVWPEIGLQKNLTRRFIDHLVSAAKQAKRAGRSF